IHPGRPATGRTDRTRHYAPRQAARNPHEFRGCPEPAAQRVKRRARRSNCPTESFMPSAVNKHTEPSIQAKERSAPRSALRALHSERPVTVLLVDDQMIVGESVRRMLADEP